MRGLRFFLGVCITSGVAGGAVANEAEIDLGSRLFATNCGRCHLIGADAHSRVGPHLNGIFDRGAGSVEAFKYSKSMRRAGADGLIWTADTLDAFIQNPRTIVSRTRMSFGGIDDAEQRRAIIAYLRAYSASPQDIPESAPTEAPTPLAPEELLAIQGDPAYGEYLSSECVTCHQLGGQEGGVPSIIGWPQPDFKAALHAYREGIRPNEVMGLIAGTLGDEEIAALAAYFETQGE